jgi:hypothetical protein
MRNSAGAGYFFQPKGAWTDTVLWCETRFDLLKETHGQYQ